MKMKNIAFKKACLFVYRMAGACPLDYDDTGWEPPKGCESCDNASPPLCWEIYFKELAREEEQCKKAN